jgi:glycosyltransferase involved in cell wall biosynthesis
MHTLLIHQIFMSPEDSGGTRHYELGKRVVDTGDNFTIVASDLNYLTGKRILEDQGFIAEQNFEGVKVLRTYTYPSLHRGFTWRIISFLSFTLSSFFAGMTAKNVDVVMGTSPPIFQCISAWLIAKIRNKPFLLEIRDLWPDFAIDIGVLKSPILIGLSRWLESFLYKSAKCILVNSPAYRDYLLDKGIPAEKIVLISNGVEVEQFNPEHQGKEWRQSLGIDDKFVVTYTGSIGMANDIATLLKAAAIVKSEPNIEIVLVGDGKERKIMEKMAEDLQLSNLRFTGIVSKREIPSIIAGSDICLAILKDIPMFRKPYPNKVFDYMAGGRATILAIDGVIRDVIEKSHGGIFVQPGDEQKLAEAIIYLSQNSEIAKQMGASARKYVVENFDRKEHGKAFVKLLQELTN